MAIRVVRPERSVCLVTYLTRIPWDVRTPEDSYVSGHEKVPINGQQEDLDLVAASGHGLVIRP
jgi:hypothetical protein